MIISNLSSCKYGKITLIQNSPTVSDSFSDQLTIGTDTVKSISLNSCTQCHSGKKLPNMITDNDIRNHIISIQNEIMANTMPPLIPLSDCQKSILTKWIEIGMPDSSNIKVNSIQSCANGKPQEPETPILSEQNIGYKTVMTTALRTCSSCHTKQDPILKNSDQYKENIENILSEIEDNFMPPEDSGLPALTQCERDILNTWVNLDMPDESNVKIKTLPSCSDIPNSPQVMPIFLMPLTYDTVYSRILKKKCSSCHSETGSEGWLKFYPYSEIEKNAKFWKTPGESSKMVRLMGQQQMPPLDSGIEQTTPDEINFIIDWINAGMPQ